MFTEKKQNKSHEHKQCSEATKAKARRAQQAGFRVRARRPHRYGVRHHATPYPREYFVDEKGNIFLPQSRSTLAAYNPGQEHHGRFVLISRREQSLHFHKERYTVV